MPADTGLKNLTFLIVEDSPTMTQLLSTFLKDFKEHKTITAKDGVDALKKLFHSEAPIDLVLADINMPVMDGITMTKVIRQHPRYEKFPIIMITTESADDVRETALGVGVDAFVTKPVRSFDLVETIRVVLDRLSASNG